MHKKSLIWLATGPIKQTICILVCFLLFPAYASENSSELTVVLTDSQGKKVAGASVGTGASYRMGQLRWEVGREYTSVTSDSYGKAYLDKDKLFEPRHSDDYKIIIYALDEEKELVGLREIGRADMAGELKIEMVRSCRVHGRLESSELRELGYEIYNKGAMVSVDAPRRSEFLDYSHSLNDKNCRDYFEFFLPPGSYKIRVGGSSDLSGVATKEVEQVIQIKPGLQQLDLGMIDLPAEESAKLFGKPAPELQGIREWKNGEPIKLSDLRGKLVLLHFWINRCEKVWPQMHKLIALYEACREEELEVEIIIVHEGTVESLAEMEAEINTVPELAKVKQEKWGGKDLPFLIALDSKEPARHLGNKTYLRGINWANYYITSYPATMLIDRNGILVKEVGISLEQLKSALAMKKGDQLRNLQDFKIKLAPEDILDKSILVCFFDIGQRPSRHCVRELAKKAEELKEKGITIAAIQASRIDKGKLDKWVKDNNISFAVGMIGDEEEETLFKWGVKSLPWMILTDKEHVVRAMGFGLGQLDEKLAATREPITQEETEKHQRAAAEDEIKRLGGVVVVKTSESGEVYTEVNLNGPRYEHEWRGGDEGIKYLKYLPNLKKLRIQDVDKFSDEGMAHLKEVKSLESLILVRTQVSDDGLVHLKNLSNLEFLGLWNNSQFTNRALDHMKGLTKLKSLRLDDSQITDEGLSKLNEFGLLHQLEFLVITRTQISDAGLDHPAGMVNLKLLYLGGTKVTDAGVAHLAGLEKLEGLILNNTGITDGGLIHLKGLNNLNMLYLGETQVTDAGLEHLKGLTNLIQLGLSGTQISDAGLVNLKGLTKLQSLSLGHTKVTDAGMDSLKVLTNLNELFLKYSDVTYDGYMNLQEILPDCRIFWEEKVKEEQMIAPSTKAEMKQPRKEPEAEPKVSGIVRDTEGRPVAGAQVGALPMSDRYVLTGDGGKFEIGWKREWAGGAADICLMARHVERNLAALVDITHETKIVDIKLEPALTLTGTIVDTSGVPISGAKVGLSLREEAGGWICGTPVKGVVTNGQGRYEFGALPQRQDYGIGARSDGYWGNEITTGVINRVTARAEAGQIILKKPNLSVTGVVVDDTGKAVPNIPVYIWGEGQPDLDSQTDGEGKFRFEKICSGPINISAKNKTLFGIIETQGGTQDVKLVVLPRW